MIKTILLSIHLFLASSSVNNYFTVEYQEKNTPFNLIIASDNTFIFYQGDLSPDGSNVLKGDFTRVMRELENYIYVKKKPEFLVRSESPKELNEDAKKVIRYIKTQPNNHFVKMTPCDSYLCDAVVRKKYKADNPCWPAPVFTKPISSN